MSRGSPYDPVVTNASTNQATRPLMVKAVSVAFDPVCRTVSGTQTATPDLPPS